MYHCHVYWLNYNQVFRFAMACCPLQHIPCTPVSVSQRGIDLIGSSTHLSVCSEMVKVMLSTVDAKRLIIGRLGYIHHTYPLLDMKRTPQKNRENNFSELAARWGFISFRVLEVLRNCIDSDSMSSPKVIAGI